jgi:hypothetical protein
MVPRIFVKAAAYAYVEVPHAFFHHMQAVENLCVLQASVSARSTAIRDEQADPRPSSLFARYILES